MADEPDNKKIKYNQTKLNLHFLTPKSPRSAPSNPEPPSSSSGTGSNETTSASTEASPSSGCVEACCRDIETGKAPQLVIDKKETARTFGQRDQYSNAEWYKGSEWLILCISKKLAFCEVCRFVAVKQLVSFSKCGDDGFVKTGD